MTKQILIIIFGIVAFSSFATAQVSKEENLARKAHVSVTGGEEVSPSFQANNLIDGIKGVDGQGEWAIKSHIYFWGDRDYPSLKMSWDKEQIVGKLIFYDRPALNQHIGGGELTFSDGSKMQVFSIPNDGTAKVISFPPKKVNWIKFDPTDGDGDQMGLSEIEAYAKADKGSMIQYTKTTKPVDGDWVSWVDPNIESNRGRWFFCTPGSRPFGMVASAPYTRNKNQGGGGYNYNATDVLGFGQLHCWILSGIDFMPTTGGIDPTLGVEARKSSIKHEKEIIQPGYQKLFLERYKTQVEMTCTERVSFYRMTYHEKTKADLMVSLGGRLGSVTMIGADFKQVSPTRIEGKVGTTDRLWNGPSLTWVFFVIDFDKPVNQLNGWNGMNRLANISELAIPIAPERTKVQFEKSEFAKYILTTHPEEQAGFSAAYNVKAGDVLQMKIGVSLTSIENARNNLQKECPHWNFDQVRQEAHDDWNRWLGRIQVKGGTQDQKIKFYTDLWHVLLGRHKIDDVSGDYPTYFGGKTLSTGELKVETVDKGVDGKPLHHMYNSDALWLTMWNLNILWGLGWPEMLDEFTQSWMEYAKHGGMLPRGPSGGAYTKIMGGSPATSLFTCAYQKGLLKHVDPEKAFAQMKKDHLPGGMQGVTEFYDQNGWTPIKVGEPVQWSFEDWALAQMAKKLGKKEDYDHFMKRSSGWTNYYSPKYGLLMPKDKDGNLLSDNPLSGTGWVEANSWQGTFSVSHGLPKLSELMGGKDSLVKKLNFAFEQAAASDFIFGYRDGYVSYANQPGCSNAHVFNRVGAPWLSQYWVRRVQEQAYGGVTPNTGYGGHDEDQGQMGGVSALMAMGLFSVTGTCDIEPTYEISSPIFDEVKISLDPRYYSGKEFIIKTYNNSKENRYIQRSRFNDVELNKYWFYHKDFAKGGKLELWLGSKPNKKWGIDGSETK